MARKRRIILCALNIKLLPHSVEKYIDLFKTILSIEPYPPQGKIWGSEYAIFGSLKEFTKDRPEEGVYGVIYRYTSIDMKLPWLLLDKMKQVKYDKKHQPVPENIKPNLKEISYAFFPQKHRMVFDATKNSPGSIKKAIDQMFQYPDIEKRFGRVVIAIESSREGINQIIRLHKKTKLFIELTVPNDDVIMEETQKRIMKRLMDNKIRKETLEQMSDQPEGIQLDDETRAKIELSKSNGKTIVHGFTEDEKKVIESTENHNLEKKVFYDPEDISINLAVFQYGNDLVDEIVKK
jgi:hypothetical protein